MPKRTTQEFPQGYSMYLEGKAGDAVGYLRVPAHAGKTARQARLSDLIGDYTGPDIIIDLDAEDALIGIEIVE